MRHPIFITARFRTGSTMLWNIFRQIPDLVTFYEPLHEQLPFYIKNNIPAHLTHIYVDEYFREYSELNSIHMHHSIDFGVHRLFLEAKDTHPLLKKYIQYLIDSVPALKIPVLKFNRIDFRLPWIKANFPEATIVHLWRCPRDQWVSTIAKNQYNSNNIFEPDPYRINTWARDLCHQFPFLADPYLRHQYQRHYYLWQLSNMAGSRLSNLSIRYEDILSSPKSIIESILSNLKIERANIKKCVSVVKERPVGQWNKYQDKKWFDQLENDCNGTLNETGLNEYFGMIPLSEIIEKHEPYIQLKTNTKHIEWLTHVSQTNMVSLLNILDEKEEILKELKSVCNHRKKELGDKELIIQSLNADCNQRQKELGDKELIIQSLNAELSESKETVLTLTGDLIHNQEITLTLKKNLNLIKKESRKVKKQLETKEELIQIQQNELVAKEAVIQSLIPYRGSSLRYWSERAKKYIAKKHLSDSKLNLFRTTLELNQHTPIPLKIPDRYYRTRVLNHLPLPTVSIVTPSFNQGHFIERTIQSVINQNYPNLEYVVQDGGSSDGTKQILKKYRSKLFYTESRKDKGQAHALNLGFERTHGQIMAYLNSDDMLLPGTISYVVNYFLRHPKIDVVYGLRINVDENDREIGRWVLPPHDNNMLLWADLVPQETLFWRREIWEKTGGHIDESFRFAMDWELLLRFRSLKAKFARLPRFLGAFRIHRAQKTQAWNSVGQEEIERLRRFYHGRNVTGTEVMNHIRHYLRRSGLCLNLYRMGIFKY